MWIKIGELKFSDMYKYPAAPAVVKMIEGVLQHLDTEMAAHAAKAVAATGAPGTRRRLELTNDGHRVHLTVEPELYGFNVETEARIAQHRKTWAMTLPEKVVAMPPPGWAEGACECGYAGVSGTLVLQSQVAAMAEGFKQQLAKLQLEEQSCSRTGSSCAGNFAANDDCPSGSQEGCPWAY